MKRRQFITLLGGAAVAWPLVARAQQASKAHRIGFLGPDIADPASSMAALYRAFLTQLRALGFNEGQNLVADYGTVDDPRGLSAMVADLLRSRPELIVVSGAESMLQAVVAANSDIPIVLIAVNFDPIARGYIASLARPGGRITGVVFQQLELAQKQVEILTQAFPDRTRLAAMFDAQTADQFSAAEYSAKLLNLQMLPIKLEKPPYDFEAAFRSAALGGAQIIVVLSSPLFVRQQAQIGEMARMHRMPTMFLYRAYVDAGGLMSYGVDFPPMYRRAAELTSKILNGEKPADIPAEQATKFEMVINLRTAKAIEVELPTSILLRADEVIE
jgi:putative ABC transport system substrate-binding protein